MSNRNGEGSSLPARKRGRGWWWKVPLTLVAVLVLVLAVVWFRLSEIATWAVNKKLPDFLNAEVSVGRVELRPARGLAAIHNLRIGQPPGFGDGSLIELERVLAQVDLGSLRSADGILVRAVELEGLTAHLVKDAEGMLNVLKLVPPPTEAAPETPPAAPASPIPGIRIERLDVSRVAVDYTDHTAGARPIEISLGNLGVALAGGRVALAETPSVALREGTVTLEGIHISQPDDFGTDALLDLSRIQLDLGSEPFADNIVRLQRLAVDGLRAHIVRNAQGVINAARLGGGPPPPAETSGEIAATAEAVAASPAKAGEPVAPPVGVYLAALEFSDFAVTYTDAALGKTGPIEFVVRDLGLTVQDLMAFLPEPPAPAASIEFSAALAQGENPDAHFTLVAALGPIPAGIPDLNAQIRITGLMLDTLGELVPPGTRQTVGADGGDIRAGLALNQTSIDLDGMVDTDAGHSYPMLIKGPLEKPAVDLGPLMFAMAGRVFGGVVNLAGGTADAAMDVAQGVAGGAKELSKGAAGIVAHLGGGLLKTATGAMKGDLGQMEDGMSDATAGSVKGAADAVSQAGDKVAAETRAGADSVTGGKRTAEWMEAIAARHQEGVTAAREALPAMPFPPPVISAPAADAAPPAATAK